MKGDKFIIPHCSRALDPSPAKGAQRKLMEKFREFIIKLAETCPNTPSNPAHKTLLQDRLNQWFSEYKTPDHPPYSAMIERALSELNEKKGSTEDEIAQFIIKEYDALPWAHLTLLEHHLEILCKSGDIVLTRGKRYMLAGETSSTKGKKKKRKRKSRWAWEREIKKKRKKRNQPKGNRIDCIEEHKESDEKLTENDVNSEEKQNEDVMAVDEMEHSRDMPQELEINPSEIMNGHICGADKEEKQEEGQTNDNQLAVSSPERPPGFESIIVENLSDSGIFLRTCLSSQEQSMVVGEIELLDLPFADKKLDSPREPSVHDLSISENSLELTELSEMKRSSEAHKMAVPAQEGNPESVEVHETVSNTSLTSYSSKEEAIHNVQVPRWKSGIVSASAEEISTSKRMERQRRRWSLHSPKAVDVTGPCTSSRSNHHQLSDVDQWKESVLFPNPEQHLLYKKNQCELLEADVVEVVQPVTTDRKPREIMVYGRRTKTRPEQSKNTIQVVPMKSDVNLFEPNATVGSRNSSMNEHEPQELLQRPPSLQGENLQDKASRDEDANLIDVLQPEHQPEECQKTVLKRRGRPPKHKLGRGMCKILSPSLCQEMIHANQQHQEPPSLQGETLQDKPSHDEDANLIDVLQPRHQPEECQKTVLKRRGRPPKHKLGRGICKILSPTLCQEMIHANQQHQEPPKHQTRQRQHKENADATVVENVKSIHSQKAEATRTDDLLLLSDFAPKLRLGRPRKR